MTPILSTLSLDLADGIALSVLILTWVLTGWLVEHPPKSRPSVTVLMAQYRRDWLRQFVTRSPRIFDANIIDSLRQSTAFFASASMIAIGGGVALIGNVSTLEGLAHDLTLEAAGVRVELKIILVLLFLANALLKFVWSHRLFGYCAILMAAVPNDVSDPLAYPRAAQAAAINITAAKSFNRGLQAIYFALASITWLLGPWALLAATVITCIVLLRREFASASRQVMLAR
ncbi:DUF599 domain-containing protein [Pseudotabrizicola alkalilacus]|uniref:DUF599 domain-containing protein n=1 Tax=Pseudotabrizicola alkalilacus TaxID=2305252 RepID=A0A411Z6A2_9RHOB|nr:DUF599 domain-containing protein [Pseudotabrizicola alkalilacus]RGP38542.1 DUF599 domain-containing protein [Pseudotabrizicola alkalilacus]